MEATTEGEVAPKIKILQFDDSLQDVRVFFQVFFLKDSFLVWIGTEASVLSNLALAIKTPYVSSLCNIFVKARIGFDTFHYKHFGRFIR
jgi:hypothetical protein